MRSCRITIVGHGTRCRRIVELFATTGVGIRLVTWPPHDRAVGLWRGCCSLDIEVRHDFDALGESELVVVSVPEWDDLQREVLGLVEQKVSGRAAIAIDTSTAPLETYVDGPRSEQVVALSLLGPTRSWNELALTSTARTAAGVRQSLLEIGAHLGCSWQSAGDAVPPSFDLPDAAE